MMYRGSLIISVALLSIILLTQVTFAVCVQEDIQGVWSAQVGAIDEFGETCWESCNLTIGSGGIIEAGGTYTDCLDQASEITGGGLNISSGCVIEGMINTSNGTVNIYTGAIVGDQLVLGTGQ